MLYMLAAAVSGLAEAPSSSTLVVYFSATGTTKAVAEQAAEYLNTALYEIVPEQPYTAADLTYYTGGRCDQEQNDPSVRPAIASEPIDLTPYDTVLIGYPIWHGQAPRIISTFLESCDFSGKRLACFCTSHSSGLGSSARNLEPLVSKDAVWLESKRFAAGAPANEIAAWLDGIGAKPAKETVQADVLALDSKTVTLNSGYPMPVIGLGTWTLSNDQAEASVYAALKTGMQLIDTARYYGNEVGVGRGIRRAMDDGIVTREEIFVTSKSMPSDYDRAAQGIDNSLQDLGLDYVDLMLIHQPGWNDEAVYRAMEQAVRDGKVRSIGISNYYTPEAVEEILSFAEIMPAVIQNENHLYYQNKALQEYVQQYGIVVESWYPFGGRGHTQEHFTNETIVRIANAHEKTPAQIILRWQIQDGYITIPGSSNPDHIAENYDIFDFELTDQEMTEIRDLDLQERYENW